MEFAALCHFVQYADSQAVNPSFSIQISGVIFTDTVILRSRVPR
jgi:hypothetical protein